MSELDISTRLVSSLDDNQIDRAAEVLVAAFKADPLLVLLVGGELDLSKALFKGFIAATIVGGDAYFAEHKGDVVGVALWFGPGKEFLASQEQLDAGWNEFWNKLSTAGQQWQNETYIPRSKALYARSLPTSTSRLDSYHCPCIGVSPDFRGSGIGSRLIREAKERAQRHGTFVSLDTETETNIGIYKRWGFQERGSDRMTSIWGDFVMTIMVWEPEVHRS